MMEIIFKSLITSFALGALATIITGGLFNSKMVTLVFAVIFLSSSLGLIILGLGVIWLGPERMGL